MFIVHIPLAMVSSPTPESTIIISPSILKGVGPVLNTIYSVLPILP